MGGQNGIDGKESLDCVKVFQQKTLGIIGPLARNSYLNNYKYNISVNSLDKHLLKHTIAQHHSWHIPQPQVSL
jgi:hypothetical protein